MFSGLDEQKVVFFGGDSMVGFNRVICTLNSPYRVGTEVKVDPKETYILIDNTAGNQRGVSGKTVIEMACSVPMATEFDKLPIQNVRVTPYAVTYTVVEYPASMIWLNTVEGTYKANFHVPFNVGIQNCTSNGGEIILGDYRLPYKVKALKVRHDWKGYIWSLGNIASIQYSEDAPLRGIILKNTVLRPNNEYITGVWQYDIRSSDGRFCGASYKMKFSFKSGYLTFKIDNVVLRGRFKSDETIHRYG